MKVSQNYTLPISMYCSTINLLILLLATLLFPWNFGTQWSEFQSQSHIATDSQSVSQSVGLAVELNIELMTRFWLLFDSYGLVYVARLLWREDGSVFCIWCWPFAAQSFSGLSPLVFATIFYCLLWIPKSKISHSRTFLYPLGMDHAQKTQPPIAAWRRPHKKQISSTVEWHHRACVNVFTELLPGNASQYTYFSNMTCYNN
jgi:hypothetical protein